MTVLLEQTHVVDMLLFNNQSTLVSLLGSYQYRTHIRRTALSRPLLMRAVCMGSLPNSVVVQIVQRRRAE